MPQCCQNEEQRHALRRTESVTGSLLQAVTTVDSKQHRKKSVRHVNSLFCDSGKNGGDTNSLAIFHFSRPLRQEQRSLPQQHLANQGKDRYFPLGSAEKRTKAAQDGRHINSNRMSRGGGCNYYKSVRLLRPLQSARRCISQFSGPCTCCAGDPNAGA